MYKQIIKNPNKTRKKKRKFSQLIKLFRPLAPLVAPRFFFLQWLKDIAESDAISNFNRIEIPRTCLQI
jgi:hypothetical protein